MSEVLTEPNEIRIGDVILDSPAISEMRKLVVDTTIDLPPSGRTAHENKGKINREKLLDIGRGLLALIETPDEDITLLTETHLSRASKLGLSPSVTSYVNHVGSVSQLQYEIGCKPQHEFSLWTKEDFVHEGRKLADELDRRPTARFLQANPHRFPSRFIIIKKFGDMATFHELIGRPSFNKSEKEDFMEWGTAVIKQNPNKPFVSILTKESIEYWSKHGKGPSAWQVGKHFGTVREFRAEVVDRCEDANAINQQKIEKARAYLDEVDLRLDERTEKIDPIFLAARHKLVKRFAPDLAESKAHILVSRYSTQGIAEALIDKFGAVDFADVEVAALEMDIFDDLWPMYRFQNVDLAYPGRKNLL